MCSGRLCGTSTQSRRQRLSHPVEDFATCIRLCCCAATNTASRASSMPPFVCPVGGSCGEGSGGEDDGSDGGSGNGSSGDTTCVRGRCVVVVS